MQSNHGKRSRAYWARCFRVLWAVLALAAGGGASAAPVKTVLYSFTGGGDGSIPPAPLIADRAGNLYGTTFQGGALGQGVAFKLAPSGTETVLHSFAGSSNGRQPTGGLIADSAGNLYGMTVDGGASDAGVIFKLSPSGTETVLYSFTGGSDGAYPEGGLIADDSGNLYGTTVSGGASGHGTVFKLSPSGTETVLHYFTGGSDGAYPEGGRIADSSGNLYGTTFGGGSASECDGVLGCGVVFKLMPSGTETVLHSFTGLPNDGSALVAGLIADSAGNLYGTTEAGGASGQGTVFKLSPSGTETVLHSFAGGSDGRQPTGDLIADGAGNLYGTTEEGGTSGQGTVFKLSPSGTETVLFSFTGGSDGDNPVGGLIADSAGNLYGTTGQGGTLGCNGVVGCGTVFKLTGTGFVTGIPFAAFNAKLAIDLDHKPNPDAFELNSEFTLGLNSKGINPAAEPVTLQIGAFIRSQLVPSKGQGLGRLHSTGRSVAWGWGCGSNLTGPSDTH